ncbi:MAG: hypothetical protein ABIN91_10190 [Mucilaginibacter sp.]|uniref:hypothetical protein n=1 Tax=Mucilaginibacter sp. TaxID=1882438 RepID=UPI003267E64D
MKTKLPEYLLCEDPTSEKENLFIYHVQSRSLVHIMHTDAIPDAGDILYINRRHFDYTYSNNLGKTEKIMFVAEIVDSSNVIEQSILEQCAHWYACYLGWEENCDDVKKSI